MTIKSIYQCTNCGIQTPTWSGKCYSCGEWSTLVAVEVNNSSFKNQKNSQPVKIIKATEIVNQSKDKIPSGFKEVDSLLGGGFVSGSVLLLGGEPGIGKSTLALQLALQAKNPLYVCGEESPVQIKERALRLNSKIEHLNFLDTPDVMMISASITNKEFDLIIVDSIQTTYHPDFPNTPGSPVQLRESALVLVKLARSLNLPIIIIGQVTKEGSVAGPRLLEHVVDIMMYLEGERTFGLRLLRTVKNRFGYTSSEVLKLTESGFKSETQNAWIENYHEAYGSAVTVTFIGKRPLVIEIQALVEPMIGSYPKRNSPNFSISRLDQIVAIINAHTEYKIYNHDIFINIAGGINISDPGIDMAIASALISAKDKRKISNSLCLLGELSLTGKIRQPQYFRERINEAKKIGFAKTVKFGYIDEASKIIFK